MAAVDETRAKGKTHEHRSEVRDGMRIGWDVPIAMDDGLGATEVSSGKDRRRSYAPTGCGKFLHDDPRDRPMDVLGGVTSLHFGRDKQPYLLLPIIPAKKS